MVMTCLVVINKSHRSKIYTVKIEIVYVVRDEVRWIVSYHIAKWQT